MEPSAPTYLIFSGRFPETDVLWLESAVGFGTARERMQRLAAQKPGPYFIFSTNIHVVLATIDSTPAPRAMRRLHSARFVQLDRELRRRRLAVAVIGQRVD